MAMELISTVNPQVGPAPSYRWPIPRKRTLCVAVIGPGGIGATLLDQLREALPSHEHRVHREPQVRVLCNSKRMLLSPGAIDLAHWRDALSACGEAASLERLNQFLAQEEGPVAIVDVTAAPEIAEHHTEWLRRGYLVLTANKMAASAPWSEYAALRQAEAAGGSHYYCETTVGAGLPVLGVLGDFVRTGDEVLKVEGVLSGTLSHLFTRVEQGVPFSAAVRSLHAEGFTEPDPRADLAGLDVARKLVILARIAGIRLDLSGLAVTGCVDLAPLEGASVPEFLAAAGRYDAEVAALSAKAKAQDAVLRYTATVERGGAARVGLAMVPLSHPFARLRPGDNLVQITTARYRDNPLVVQGPGAGRAVTAAGLLADLLRCAEVRS